MEKIIELMRTQGKTFLCGEYRGHKVETIKYVDKKSGQALAFTLINFLVERPGRLEAVTVTQSVGQGEIDPATVKLNVQKGKVYAFEIIGLEKVRGVLKAKMASKTEPLPI